MADTAPALLPCPWCGSAALLSKYTNTDWYGHWGVCCSDPNDTCAVKPWTVSSQDDAGKAAAIAAWNQRASGCRPTGPIEVRNDALEEAAKVAEAADDTDFLAWKAGCCNVQAARIAELEMEVRNLYDDMAHDHDAIKDGKDTCMQQAARIAALEAAVAWANGEDPEGYPEFQPRQSGEPPYWWRTTMRKIANGTIRRATLTLDETTTQKKKEKFNGTA